MKRLIHCYFTLALLAMSGSAALAMPTACPEHFADGEAPEISDPKLAMQTVPLCYTAFAVMHSGVSRTPLWSAERLDRERIGNAQAMKRRNAFHAEPRLDPEQRAELRDYSRSGYDRGHMSPSGDMPDERSQQESFSLANIIPQDRNNNQNLWAGIEEKTRGLAMRRREIYVITGPMFEGGSIARINGRVLVPTHIFKAVYDPARGQAGAYIVRNAPGSDHETVSIAELERRSRINLFPRMPDAIKHKRMDLPEPAAQRSSPRRDKQEHDWLQDIFRTLGIGR
jgi:endonuclease G